MIYSGKNKFGGKKIKKRYEMICSDGFRVQSGSKEEVATLAEWHLMLQHPEIQMSTTYALERVTVVKEI